MDKINQDMLGAVIKVLDKCKHFFSSEDIQKIVNHKLDECKTTSRIWEKVRALPSDTPDYIDVLQKVMEHVIVCADNPTKDVDLQSMVNIFTMIIMEITNKLFMHEMNELVTTGRTIH